MARALIAGSEFALVEGQHWLGQSSSGLTDARVCPLIGTPRPEWRRLLGDSHPGIRPVNRQVDTFRSQIHFRFFGACLSQGPVHVPRGPLLRESCAPLITQDGIGLKLRRFRPSPSQRFLPVGVKGQILVREITIPTQLATDRAEQPRLWAILVRP